MFEQRQDTWTEVMPDPGNGIGRRGAVKRDPNLIGAVLHLFKETWSPGRMFQLCCTKIWED